MCWWEWLNSSILIFYDNNECNVEMMVNILYFRWQWMWWYEWLWKLYISDNNECEGTNDCEHLCANIDGGFQCSCLNGYELESNDRNCKGNHVIALFTVISTNSQYMFLDKVTDSLCICPNKQDFGAFFC